MTPEDKFKRFSCTETVRSDLRGKSVRAAAFTGVAGFADFALRIGSTAVLARLIVPEHFGLVMMVMAVTAIADQLRELGLSAATVQQKEITHGQVSNLFWINVLAGTAIALLVAALSPAIAAYYKEPRLVAITCLLALNFLFGGLMVQHQALLTRQLKLGHTSLIRFGASLVSTILAIGLAWKGFGYWALVWRELSRNLLLAAGMWLCCPWIPGFLSRRTNVRGMVGFGTNLTLSNILGTVSGGVDRFMIGRFLGAGPVAIYRQAYQLIVAPTDQLLSPIYQVAQPGLCMLQSDPVRFRKFFQKVLTVVCMITMPLSLFIAVYSTEVTLVLLGPKWIECAPIFQILAFGTFIKQAGGSTAQILVATGRSQKYLRLTMLYNLIFIGSVTIGVRWGILGVAIADVFAAWLFFFPRVYYGLNQSPFAILQFFKTLFRPAISSSMMAIALFVVKNAILISFGPLISLILGGFISITLFLMIWMLLPGGTAELFCLFSDIKSGIRKKKLQIKEDPQPALS